MTSNTHRPATCGKQSDITHNCTRCTVCHDDGLCGWDLAHHCAASHPMEHPGCGHADIPMRAAVPETITEWSSSLVTQKKRTLHFITALQPREIIMVQTRVITFTGL